MSQLRDDLIAAKALITDEASWGKGVGLHGPDAPKMCVYGACGRGARCVPAMQALDDALPPGFVPADPDIPAASFNDDPATTHADIMALFDRAIEAAK